MTEYILQPDTEWADEYPYRKTRLKDIPYRDIIKKGKPWNDPTFPHGPQALFINGKKHQGHDNWTHIDDQKFYWRRASAHFRTKGLETVVFDGISPTDIIQGKCANCYFLAAIAGLAEDPPDIAHLKLGTRICDNFIVKDANKAGCYAMTFFVDGEDVTVVVDDWFPFYLDKDGIERFCFARNKGNLDTGGGKKSTKSLGGKGELWVQLIEKAWAKVCGSYEASEAGTAAEALNNIDGNPCQSFLLPQIEAKGQHALLWSILEEADRNMYVATCSVDSTQRCSPDLLTMFGLCDFHSYTMMQAIAVPV